MEVWVEIPAEAFVVGEQMASGYVMGFSGSDPSSGGSTDVELTSIEIVEITDTCVAGRFSRYNPVGFVAARQ